MNGSTARFSIRKTKEYSAQLKVTEGGSQLEVRGYLGFALIGRTQTWHRVD